MFYTYSELDRVDHLRKDSDAIDALRQQPDALIAPVWQGKSLVVHPESAESAQATFVPYDLELPNGQSVFLGMDDGKPCFAVDVSALDENQRRTLATHAQTRQGQSARSTFADLRVAGPTLSDQDGSLLAYARGLIYWNDNTRHCIRCGSRLASENAGHVRRCTNTACDYLVFPRTDPAVIMLVTQTPDNGDEPMCLLGRSPAWPEGVFSTLAGFVEPGESLEQAVQREVHEEAGIYTHNVRYIASQPWPFPRSIMLGFEAIATTTRIEIDPTEIEEAQWFTRAQLSNFGNWGDDSPGLKLPRVDSIARFLIDRWMGKHPSSE